MGTAQLEDQPPVSESCSENMTPATPWPTSSPSPPSLTIPTTTVELLTMTSPFSPSPVLSHSPRLCLLSVSQPPYLASMLVAWLLSLGGEPCPLEAPSLTNSRRLMTTSSPTPSVQATTAPTASPLPWSVLLTLARTPAKETLVVPWSLRRMEDMPR